MKQPSGTQDECFKDLPNGRFFPKRPTADDPAQQTFSWLEVGRAGCTVRRMRFFPVFSTLLAVWLGVFPAGRALAQQDTGPAFTGELAKPLVDELPMLPTPAGMLLDEANVFQPAKAAELAAVLQGARDRDVWVYVLTVPTLRVTASQQRAALEALAKRYVKAWLPAKSGAMILFDDESGLVTIEMSAEATRRFSEILLQIEMVEPVGKAQLEGLSREKLEKVSRVVADVLSRLQAKHREEIRRQRVANTIMAVLALFGVALLIRSATAAGQKPEPAVDEVEADVSSRPPPAA